MKYKKQVKNGICVSILVWLSLILADLIDEFVFCRGIFVVALDFVIMPFIMILCYIKFYITFKPQKKELLVWFGSYSFMYLVLWYVIFYMVNTDKFIPQKSKSGSIDLNGIEYMFYGFSTLLFFSLLCIIFHIIYNILKRKH